LFIGLSSASGRSNLLATLAMARGGTLQGGGKICSSVVAEIIEQR